jgi:hypothetical protein
VRRGYENHRSEYKRLAVLQQLSMSIMETMAVSALTSCHHPSGIKQTSPCKTGGGGKRYAAVAVQVITHTQRITGCSSAVIFKLDCMNNDLMLLVAALGECDQGRELWREEGACRCTVLLPVNLQSKGECDAFGCGKENFEL